MTMKKFLNQPENIVSELLEGLELANPDIIEVTGNNLSRTRYLRLCRRRHG